MNNKKLIVGITQGDGNGIGYEVIIKSLADARILDSFTPVIYGSSKIFGFYRKQIHDIDPLDTYVIKGERGKGDICLNGAAARKVMKGDIVIIMAYAYVTPEEARDFKPKVVFPDTFTNRLIDQ